MRKCPTLYADVNGTDQTQSFVLTLAFPPEILVSVLALVRDDDEDSATLLSTAVVSKFWNECTNSILYNSLDLSWDSRTTRALLRTVDSRPTLLPLVRNVTIYYSNPFKLDPYNPDQDVQRFRKEEYRRLLERLGLPPNPDEDDDRSFTDDYGDHEEEVMRLVEPVFLECLQSRGEGNWAGLDGRRRREGLLALFAFLARCPRLNALEPVDVDLGNAVELSLVRPRPLLSLQKLTATVVDSAAQHFILSLTPNLEMLLIDPGVDDIFESAPLPPLPKLHTITLSSFSNENLPLLIDIIDACGPALRRLVFDFSEWHMEQDIPNILPKVSQLEELAISMLWEHYERRRGQTLPTSPLLSALSRSALTSICLSCHPSIPILNSLPSSLVTLDLDGFPTRALGTQSP